MPSLKQSVQISMPFTMLHDTYLDRFLSERLNPEIALEADALDRFARADFIEIAKRLQRQALRVTLHGPFMDLAVGSSDKTVRSTARNRYEQLLDLIPVFKPQTVVCHAGYDWRRYGYHPAGWFERSVRFWSWLAQRLKDNGVRLMLENVYEQNPSEMLTLLEPLKEFEVGFCLDVGHQAVFGTASIDRWCRELAEYIGQLHLHDNNGLRDDHQGLGRGKIDFGGLLKQVSKLSTHQPVVTLEVHREEDLYPSLEFLERLWPW